MIINKKFSVIDLFAGAGGLSLGFEQTNNFEIRIAFENNPSMQETYKKNHPLVDVRGDVCAADYHKITSEYGQFDVVIGGPPCQGFSNANRQENHTINQNNMLVKQYIRAIIELQPKAFVMENVSMLKSDVHRFYLSQDDIKVIEEYNITNKVSNIKLLDKKYYFSGAEDIVKNEALISKFIWPEKHYTILNVIYRTLKNKFKTEKALKKYQAKLIKYAQEHLHKDTTEHVFMQDQKTFEGIINYFNAKVTIESLTEDISASINIQRMLNRVSEILINKIIVNDFKVKDGLFAVVRSCAVYDYLKAILGSDKNGYIIIDKVLCAADFGAPQKRKRFIVMGIKKSISDVIELPQEKFFADNYRTVRDAIGDLEDITPIYDIFDDIDGIQLPYVNNISELGSELRDSEILKNHIVTKTTDIAMKRFEAIGEGQNFHSLSDEMKVNTYTDAKRTQNTIYLRLKYDEPSGTVVNVRKSMWIHPVKNRAVSIREAARLQTFPDSFVFYGTKDKQYQQVGNAVPPILAKAIAEKLASLLRKELGIKNNDG